MWTSTRTRRRNTTSPAFLTLSFTTNAAAKWIRSSAPTKIAYGKPSRPRKTIDRRRPLLAAGCFSEGENLFDKLRISEAGFGGRLGEVLLGGKDRIGIGLDEHNLAVSGQAQVNARVAGNGK